MTDRASASLPDNDPLFAPGLKRRARRVGEVRYWIPPEKDIKRGFVPKSQTLSADLTEQQVAIRCRELWRDLEDWRSGTPKPTKYTISWLIDRYLSDSTSPFASVRGATQFNYRNECKHIRKAIGDRRLEPIMDGGITRPRILGEDFLRWHHNFGRPVPRMEGGKPVLDTLGRPITVSSQPSRARHLISMVRGLLSYAVVIGVPGAVEQRAVLERMKFPTPAARAKAPTLFQVNAIVAQAEASGALSIAIATLAQYELIERRVHIIGQWEGDTWIPGWTWERVTPDWCISYYQTKTGPNLREYDLKAAQRLLSLLQKIPKEERRGAIIRCEVTGQPWKRDNYQGRFRAIARAAGVPDDVWSMDMRAGGATEADRIPDVTDRMLDDAGGWSDPKTKNRYRRRKQDNAQNVVELRQRLRGS